MLPCDKERKGKEKRGKVRKGKERRREGRRERQGREGWEGKGREGRDREGTGDGKEDGIYIVTPQNSWWTWELRRSMSFGHLATHCMG